MRVCRRISPDVMIAEFLRAEYESPRFGNRIRKALKETKIGKVVVVAPDTASKADNKLRRILLSLSRGYPRHLHSKGRLLFAALPGDIRYFEAFITRKELGDLRFINHEHWRVKEDAMRRVWRTAPLLERNRNHHASAELRAVRSLLRNGKSFGPPIIIATSLKAKKRVVLEGNVRVASIYLERLKGPHKVIVGVSRRAKDMPYY